MDRAGRRIEVLLEWRDLVMAAGHPAPMAADMMRIGASGEVRPDGVDLAAVEPWADTIGHLLRQLKYGVADPVAQIPDDLREPAKVASSSSSSSSRSGPSPRPAQAGGPPDAGSRPDHPVLVALRDWWHAEQRTDPALASLRDHHLRSIVTAGSRTRPRISRHLPGPLKNHARRIAEVIARVAPPATPPAGAGGAAGVIDPRRPVAEIRTWAPAAGPSPMAPTEPRSAVPPSRTPTPPPSISTSPSPAAPEPTEADAELMGLELADYDLITPAERDPVAIRKVAGPTGTVLAWPAAEVAGPTVLYRVVSADVEWEPDRPQGADLLTVTESLRCVDARPFQAPVRHVQVWVHAGRTREEAAAAPPVLYATCVVLAQVADVRIREDGGAVVGQWRVPPGVTTVEVKRVPAGKARRTGHSDPQYRLRPSRPSTTSFVDKGVERGRKYVYELSVEVELEGTQQLSEPVKVSITVSAELAAVTDLRVGDSDGGAGLVLRWTTPESCEVRIYRTEKPPAPGVEERPVPVTELPRARLTEDDEVGRLIEHHADGTSSMADVPWPEGWTFAYLTPVVVLDQIAAVGPSTVEIRLPLVREPKIVERTHHQILTFAWPTGADSVLAYLGGSKQSADDARRTSRPEEISHGQYVAYGGMYWRGPLPRRGCSIHLEPVAYHAGRQFTGPLATVDYPGLQRLRYSIELERDKANRPITARVQIFAEDEQSGAIPFMLVYRPDRLPLHVRDGRALPMAAHTRPTPRGGRAVPPLAAVAPSAGQLVHPGGRAGRLPAAVRLPVGEGTVVCGAVRPVDRSAVPEPGPRCAAVNPDADDATRRLPVAGHLDVSRHLCTGHDTGRDRAWGTGRDLGPAGVLPVAPAALDVAGPASPSPPGAKPRFGQLTYTSFHRPDGSGGWQVKEVLGGITAEEQPPLVERVTGVEVGKLPRFLSQEEVDWLPRRLVHGPVRGAGTAYWHTVPAGLDSSGRPGNMFAHVLLDRRPETPTPPLRPSDLLRSTLWLRPFGSERVLDAALTPMEDPPSPEADYTRAAVLEFLPTGHCCGPARSSGSWMPCTAP